MEGHPCYTVFQEIMYHNSRLAVLGEETIQVLNSMKTEGMSDEVIAPLMEVAMKAAGLESRDKEKERKEIKRCKWWNRGYCREKESCSFDHPSGNCEDHLKGRCRSKGCKILRHRKICKYFITDTECHRGETCEYLHEKDKDDNEKDEKDVEVLKTKYNNKEQDTQTLTEEKCICKEKCIVSKVQYEKDKVICIPKRAICSGEEWKDYEDKVESEMDLAELLEGLGKILEATNRLTRKKN